jgi:uracil-DNA glycosylase
MTLDEISDDIRNCECCNLHSNGRCVPVATEHTKYILLLDHLKIDMEENMMKLWELFKEVNLSREEFLVMHTTQCRTKTTRRMGKMYTPAPSRAHREECRPFLHAYLQTIRPEKMLVMGNVAMEHVGCGFDGIKQKNATVEKPKMFGMVVPCVLSVSPSYLTKGYKGHDMIKKSLEIFKYL